MEYLQIVCNTFCEMFSAFYIARTYLHKPYKIQLNEIIAYLIQIIAALLISNHRGVLIFLIVQVVYAFYFFSLSKGSSLFDCFLLLYMTHISMLLIESLTTLPIVFLMQKTSMSFLLFSLLSNIILPVFTLLLFHIPVLRRLYDSIKQSALAFRLILINSYALLIFALFYYKLHPESLYQSYIIFFCLGLFLLALNLWLLYYDQRTRLQQQEIDSYQKNMPIYDSLIHEIRANQHEYANHLQSLANLSVMYKDYDSLSRALQSYSLEFSNPMVNYPLLQINMPLLAASLYSMASHAQEKGIALQFDIVNAVLESHAPEHELTDYITILTQNAIEACKAGDTIYALLDSKEGSVQYEIRNPVPAMISPEEIGNFFKRGYSTKQTQASSDATSKRADSAAYGQADDKRGLGLYYLQTNITKAGGSVGADCVCYEDSYFIIFRLIL